MKFHQLVAFAAVIRAGGIRAAARSLGLSQGAITKAIRELEAQAGVPLVVRGARGVTLTETGQQLALRAQLIVEQMRAAQDDVGQLRAGVGGKLTIGLTPTIIETVLPQIVRRFRARMPGVKLVIHEAALPGSLADIRDGTFDLAVVGAASVVTEGKDLYCERLLSVPKRVALRRGHPLERIRDPSMLKDAVWLLPQEPTDATDPMFVFAEAVGLPLPLKTIECATLPVTVALLASSDMVSALPEPLLVLPHLASRLVSLNFEQQLQPSQYVLVRRSSIPMSPAALLMADLLRLCTKEIVP